MNDEAKPLAIEKNCLSRRHGGHGVFPHYLPLWLCASVRDMLAAVLCALCVGPTNVVNCVQLELC